MSIVKNLSSNIPANLLECFHQENSFMVTTHCSPDGDAMGSLCGLITALKNKGKQVAGCCQDLIPQRYQFLAGANQILQPFQYSLDDYVAVILDCGDLKRVGENVLPLIKNAKYVINIDHHVSNSGFGNSNWVETEVSSCCEQIIFLLDALGWELNNDISTALYTGLVTDTGSFQYSNATADTMRLAAKLRDFGARVEELYLNLNERQSQASLLILAKTLSTLRTSSCGRLAWVIVTEEMIRETGASPDDLDGLINYPRSLEGVEIAILFREKAGEIKIGFRSKTKADVNRLASFFGGGGHVRASGATITGSIQQVIPQVTNKALEALH